MNVFSSSRRITRLRLICISLLILFLPIVIHAADSLIVDARVLLSGPLSDEDLSELLLLQATSLPGTGSSYILTLSNISPWPIDEIYILDRYFEPDSEDELSYAWAVGRLEANEVASTIIHYEDNLVDACHQIELNWASVWSSFLVDCGGAPYTTIWNIPLVEEMAASDLILDLPLSLPESVGRSKVGLHVTRNASPTIMEFVEEAQPAVIAAVGDLGWLSDVKMASPNTITLGRFAEKNQTFIGDPRQRAHEFVLKYAGRYLANPGVDYWMGWNEPVIKQEWEMAWYATFEVERARLMADLGLRVAVGNFSTGTPEADVFPAFMPAIEAVKELDGVFAVHEYSAPTMLHGVGDAIPGHEADENGGALTLRYRFWYDQYLGPADLVVPLVVTEAGIDGGVLVEQGLSLGGWRDFQGGLDEDMPTQTLGSFMDEISWYDDELRRDPYVIGFAIFNVGDTEGQWASWDITDELPAFTDLVLNKE